MPENPCIYKKENYIITQDPANRALTSEHLFDAVYGPEADQVSVFQSLTKSLDKVLSGVPLLQINYGVTSSGKTYTLFGT